MTTRDINQPSFTRLDRGLDRVVIGSVRAAKQRGTMVARVRSQHACNRMTLERLAKLKIQVDYSMALVGPSCLRRAGWAPHPWRCSACRVRGCGHSGALASKLALAARALMTEAMVPTSMAMAPPPGRGWSFGRPGRVTGLRCAGRPAPRWWRRHPASAVAPGSGLSYGMAGVTPRPVRCRWNATGYEQPRSKASKRSTWMTRPVRRSSRGGRAA